MIEYALLPEEYIDAELASKYKVVTNFSSNYIIESEDVVDANGQTTTILKKWITFRIVESDSNGFTEEQLECINECKLRFNTEHTLQIDFEVIGTADYINSLV